METRSNRLMNVDCQMQFTCSYSWLNTSQCLSGRVAMPQQHTLLHVLWRTNHHPSKSLWADVGWASPSVIFRKCRGVRVSVRGSCSHVKMALMLRFESQQRSVAPGCTYNQPCKRPRLSKMFGVCRWVGIERHASLVCFVDWGCWGSILSTSEHQFVEGSRALWCS